MAGTTLLTSLSTSGTASLNALSVTNSATIAGNLSVSGSTTLTGPLAVNNNGTFTGTVTAAGFNGPVSGTITPTGFTQGSVAFAGAGGTLTQDNANFFWDNVNKRLGVGTGSPSQKLVVRGNIQSANTDFVSGSVGSTLIMGQVAGSGNVNSYIQAYNSGALATANLLLQNIGGNVGIGTTAPAYKLDVNGTASIVDTLTINSVNVGANITDTVGSNITLKSGNTSIVVNQAAGFISSTIQGIERMRIDANGNVGIGTTAPGVKLDVAGATRILGGNQLFFQNAAGDANAILSNNGASGFSSLNIQASNGVTINGPLTTIAAAASQVVSTVKGAASQTADLQQWQNSAGTNLLQVRSDGSLAFNGYNNSTMLGVYTNGPGIIGAVFRGNASQTADLTQWINNAGTVLARVDASGNGYFNNGGGAAASPFVQNGNSFGATAILGTNDANDLQLETGGTTKLTIQNSTGNVGIGTTAPGKPLDVLVSGSNTNGIRTRTGGGAELNLAFNAGGNEAVISSAFVPLVLTGTTSVTARSGNAGFTGFIVQGATGQTADLLQAQDSTGAVLAKIDAAGNLTVKNTVVQGTLSVSGAVTLSSTLTVGGNVTFNGNVASFSGNVRGINQAITIGATTQVVTFGTAYPDAIYAVNCTANYNTTCFVTGKTTTGFTLNFGTAAPASSTVDWFVVH